MRMPDAMLQETGMLPAAAAARSAAGMHSAGIPVRRRAAGCCPNLRPQHIPAMPLWRLGSGKAAGGLSESVL